MTGTEVLRSALLNPALLGTRWRADLSDTGPHLPPIRLPKLPPCQHEPQLVVMIFDDSGSVTGSNDPVGNRYEEAAVALEHFARRCRCRADLVAVRHFDIGTIGDVGPLPLDRARLPELRNALSVPRRTYGSSSLGPALNEAERLAARFPDHPVTLMVASDFELTDASPIDVLRQFGRWAYGPVHAVVLRAAPSVELQGTNAIVTSVRWDSPRGVVASALLQTLVPLAGPGGVAP
ncbi:MAG: hypothetical protein QOE58_1898 [Actinomycetota bacterium]|nr:hypothetical protein [Actinomycetota bacterium]